MKSISLNLWSRDSCSDVRQMGHESLSASKHAIAKIDKAQANTHISPQVGEEETNF